MKSPPTPAEILEMKERALRQAHTHITSLRKKSQALVLQMPEPPPPIALPELNASQEELLAKVQSRNRTRRILLVVLFVALVLWLLQMCEEKPVPASTNPAACVEVADCGPARPKTQKPKQKPQNKVAVGKSDRGQLDFPQSIKASWLPEFRLQVSARSVPLARCFQGRQRPGAFRFRAIVFPEKGTIAEPEIEAIAESASLSSSEKTCLEGVLSDPPYRLKPKETDGLGQRVALVFEF